MRLSRMTIDLVVRTERWLMAGLLVGIASAAGGCQKVDSTDVRTHGIYPELTVTWRSATEAKVDATLWVGGALSNTYLTLTGPDHLTAYVGSHAYPMQGSLAIYESYSAIISYPATDSEVRVAFDRGPDDVSAPDSAVIVPGLFAVSPPAKAQYSRGNDALEIDWAPFDPTQLVSWSVYGTCVQLFGEDNAADAGDVVIPAGTLKKPPPPGPDEEHHPNPPDACTATASVTKSREGHVDPAFSGGTFKASQEHDVTFTSVP
jgi:hypothetical protein